MVQDIKTSPIIAPAQKKILWIFSHPNSKRSHANIKIFNFIKELDFITVRDLYDIYPDFWIDVAAEQQLLADHQMIVFQHPFFWYGMPPLLKLWLDEVLLFNYAYGPLGTALSGKDFLLSITAGGDQEAYSPEGYNQFPISDFFPPYKQTVALCRMVWHDPFVLYGAHNKTESEILTHTTRISSYLRSFINQ